MSAKYNIRLRKGGSFFRKFRWESEPFIYKPITNIQNAAPLVIECIAHGLLNDQMFVVQEVKGPTVLNASTPEKATDWMVAKVIDGDHIEVNRINASGYPAYVSGGNIKYRTVKDLTDYRGRAEIRDKYTGEVYYTLSTDLGNMIIDPVDQTFAFSITEEDALTFTWEKAVYDVELVSPGLVPIVSTPFEGEIIVDPEHTTIV